MKNLTNSEADRLIDQHFFKEIIDNSVTFTAPMSKKQYKKLIKDITYNSEKLPESIMIEWKNDKKEPLYKRILRKLFKL